MQENVERPDDLYEGPQSSWLGYLALAERVNIGDYKRYIEQVLVIILNKYASNQIFFFQNKPVVFTDPDADPKVCAECHKRFSEY